MKYTFHIVDLFSSIPFGGNQQAVLPVLMGRLAKIEVPPSALVS